MPAYLQLEVAIFAWQEPLSQPGCCGSDLVILGRLQQQRHGLPHICIVMSCQRQGTTVTEGPHIYGICVMSDETALILHTRIVINRIPNVLLIHTML